MRGGGLNNAGSGETSRFSICPLTRFQSRMCSKKDVGFVVWNIKL